MEDEHEDEDEDIKSQKQPNIVYTITKEMTIFTINGRINVKMSIE